MAIMTHILIMTVKNALMNVNPVLKKQILNVSVGNAWLASRHWLDLGTLLNNLPIVFH